MRMIALHFKSFDDDLGGVGKRDRSDSGRDSLSLYTD